MNVVSNTFSAIAIPLGTSEVLEEAVSKHGFSAHDGFFLAMSHFQLGDKGKSQQCYDRSVQWMNDPSAWSASDYVYCQTERATLRRYRDEAAKVLGIAVEAAAPSN